MVIWANLYLTESQVTKCLQSSPSELQTMAIFCKICLDCSTRSCASRVRTCPHQTSCHGHPRYHVASCVSQVSGIDHPRFVAENRLTGSVMINWIQPTKPVSGSPHNDGQGLHRGGRVMAIPLWFHESQGLVVEGIYKCRKSHIHIV